jgi:predicted nucleotidyltransferase
MTDSFETPSLERLKADLLALGEEVLAETEAVGLLGSWARGDPHPGSDLDFFVIVADEDWSPEFENRWWRLLRERVANKYGRRMDLIVYTILDLKRIATWYVLGMADEGLVVYDKGQVRDLFRQIVQRAIACGLVKKYCRGRHREHAYWTMGRELEPGEIIAFALEGYDP